MAEAASIISLVGSITQILEEVVEIIAKSRGLRWRQSARDEVHSKLKGLEMELPVMQAFLNQPDSSSGPKEEVLMRWLDALRNAKTDILDIFNEYIYLVAADTVGGGTNFMVSAKQNLRFDHHNKDWSLLSTKIDEVKSSLRTITDMKVRYDINVGNPGESSMNDKLRELPDTLRSCLLYCSVFPEDYEIERNRLIRLWVAQGYVRRDGGSKALEEVAEDYINQLIDRGLLEAIEWNNISGRVRRVKISVDRRDLVLANSKEENFCHVYRRGSDDSLVDKYRYVPIIDANQIDEKLRMNFPKFWSFHVFSPVPPAFLSNFKVLKVLDLHDVPITYLPDSIVDLYNLRYLSIRGSKIEKLPQGIGHLRKLETLDAFDTPVKSIPSGVAKLENLCHLMVKQLHFRTSSNAAISTGVEVPEGICNLTKLQTLKSVIASDGLVKNLRNLTNLRSLDIRSVKTEQRRDLFDSIERMEFLGRLIMMPKREYLPVRDIVSSPTHLHTLRIYGKLYGGALPHWICSLPKLTNMILKSSGLQRQSMESVLNFKHLVSLRLMQVYDGKELKFHSGSLPELKFLWLCQMSNLEYIQIENGALAELQELNLVNCRRLLGIPQGIENVATLQKLELEDMPKELVTRLRNVELSSEDFNSLRHIPIVKILTRKDDIWHEETLYRPLMH